MSAPNPTTTINTIEDSDDHANDLGIVGELTPNPVVTDPPVVPGDSQQQITGTFTPPPTPAGRIDSTIQSVTTYKEKQYAVSVYLLDKVVADDKTGKQHFHPHLRKVDSSIIQVTPATPYKDGSYQFTATLQQTIKTSSIFVFLAVLDDNMIGYGTVIVTPGS